MPLVDLIVLYRQTCEKYHLSCGVFSEDVLQLLNGEINEIKKMEQSAGW